MKRNAQHTPGIALPMPAIQGSFLSAVLRDGKQQDCLPAV